MDSVDAPTADEVLYDSRVLVVRVTEAGTYTTRLHGGGSSHDDRPCSRRHSPDLEPRRHLVGGRQHPDRGCQAAASDVPLAPTPTGTSPTG